MFYRKDDVLIGAPYYSKIQDEGRVYIYLNKGDTMKGDWEYVSMNRDMQFFLISCLFPIFYCLKKTNFSISLYFKGWPAIKWLP